VKDIQSHIDATWSKLKDFQKATVNYTIEQFFEHNRDKMLIADEVGLGKTIVSRGVVAKMFEEHHKERPEKPFNVIYICSNQAIAKQNIDKLNFLQGDAARNVVDYSSSDDRITALAYEPRSINREFNIRIKAFTPGTSFDQNTSSGRSDERVLLLRLLHEYPELNSYQRELSWLFKNNRRMRDDNWNNMVVDAIMFDADPDHAPEHYWAVRPIRPEIRNAFRQKLDLKAKKNVVPYCYAHLKSEHELSWVELLTKLCEAGIGKDDYWKRYELKELLKALRVILSESCSKYLQADLFILDEFQRYSKLLQTETQDNPGIELARQVLNKKDSKVLLLSATPFKPYTNDFDELHGESHYGEFKQLLKFLLQDKDEAFWKEYENDRKVFFNTLRRSKDLRLNYVQAEESKNKLQDIYRSCIARTERMLVSNNKDAMIQSPPVKLTLQSEDVKDFILFDKIVEHLNEVHKSRLPIPLEYVKSCPYPLSFLTQYAHKKKLEKHYAEDTALKALVNKSRNGWLDLKKVKNYKPLFPGNAESIPNAKIRLLFQNTVENNGWKYLWIPPSIEYYPGQGAYTDSKGYTKTLIFSAWKMVPRMVASMVSYEAERRSVGQIQRENSSRPPNYFEKKRYPYPLLTFRVKVEDASLQGMNNFMLSYPSIYLAQLYDVESNLYKKNTLTEIRQGLKHEVRSRLLDLNIFDIGAEGGDWQKWSWYSILLLDMNHKGVNHLEEWLSGNINESVDVDSDSEDSKEENSGKKKHLDEVKRVVLDKEIPNVSKLTPEQFENIIDFAVDLCLGSSTIASLRSFKKVFEDGRNYLEDSYLVGSGFTSLFNKPESIAVVQLNTNKGDYYQRVLNYSIDGNIQSMLDEYFYLMKDSNSINSSAELADAIANILSIRPSLLEVGSITELKKTDEDKQKERTKNRLRSHFAMDFGQQKLSSGATRQVNLREAFNSPFRPFVLASTSIGQEGLDFHFYSKKIIHWNLPSNPIDFEQREGRIHRFKGHVIRLNVANKFREQLNAEKTDHLWNQLFDLAEMSERPKAQFPCDLIPCWHIETDKGYSIERIVPLYPFSKDIEKYQNMLKVLAYYRLTFGQPRQDELIEAMAEAGLDDNEKILLQKLMLDLTPISFQEREAT
jgi:hypothetical protein